MVVSWLGGIDQSCFSALDSKLFNAEGQFKVTLFTHVFFFKNKDSSNNIQLKLDGFQSEF